MSTQKPRLVRMFPNHNGQLGALVFAVIDVSGIELGRCYRQPVHGFWRVQLPDQCGQLNTPLPERFAFRRDAVAEIINTYEPEREE